VKHEDVKHEEHGDDVPSFHDWVRQVPAEIREDSLWLVEAYRLSLYLGDLGWHDANAILQDRRMFEIADQLRRATSKISSSIAEGYSRNTGKGRSTYYEYAAGSAVRYRRALEWLAPGQITELVLRRALQDHTGAPHSLCRHPEHGAQSKTVFWCLADVTERTITYGRGNPCDSLDQRYAFD